MATESNADAKQYPTLIPDGDKRGNEGPVSPPPPYLAATNLYPTLPPEPPRDNPRPMVVPMPTHQCFINVTPISPPSKDAGFAKFKRARIVTESSQYMLAPALIIFGVGIAVTVLEARYNQISDICPRPSTNIWVGVLGIAVAVAGIRAGRKAPLETKRRAAVSYFVMSVSMAACHGYLVMMAVQCTKKASHELKVMHEISGPDIFVTFGQGAKILIAFVVLEVTIVVAATAHTITTIVASSLLCGAWYNNQPTPVTVIYIHPETLNEMRKFAALVPYQQGQTCFVASSASPSAPKSGQYQGTVKSDSG